MQKAVFLCVQRGSDAWKSLYDYEPYDWGPYSRPLARDLVALSNSGLVKTEEVPGHRYGRYTTTAQGEDAASSLLAELAESEQRFLSQVRTYVTSKPFAALLREVYAAYPRFATASKFSG